MLWQWQRLRIVPPIAKVFPSIPERKINLVDEVLIPVAALAHFVGHGERRLAANPVEAPGKGMTRGVHVQMVELIMVNS